MTLHAPTRRELLLGSGAFFAWAYLPKLARAEGRDPRLLVMVLRGALDGLAAVAPVADPAWPSLRGDKGLGGTTAGLPLNSFFALNPAMPNLHRLYQSGAATLVHAVATPYRERSHFDGQDVLESGFARPGRAGTGWLNRALTVLAPDDRVRAHRGHPEEGGPRVCEPRGDAGRTSGTGNRYPRQARLAASWTRRSRKSSSMRRCLTAPFS